MDSRAGNVSSLNDEERSCSSTVMPSWDKKKLKVIVSRSLVKK